MELAGCCCSLLCLLACFLRCGEVMWDSTRPTQLLVCSVTWHKDYAILLLPASKMGPLSLSPRLRVWNVLTLPSASSAPQSTTPTHPSLGCLMVTSHSLAHSSSITFAQPSLALALTHLNMLGTPFAVGQPHGWFCRALMPTPSSSLDSGIPTAIGDMLTILLLSAAQLWPLPSMPPSTAPLSLLVLPGRTLSSNLVEPPAPLQ